MCRSNAQNEERKSGSLPFPRLRSFFKNSAIRCQNHEGKSNVICIVADNGIIVRCPDGKCNRWTKITFNIPGIRLNLKAAGIIQELLPEKYHHDIEEAQSIAIPEGAR
jgi:hypothetical protein